MNRNRLLLRSLMDIPFGVFQALDRIALTLFLLQLCLSRPISLNEVSSEAALGFDGREMGL